MDPKTALDEVVHVLAEIGEDPAHAEDHAPALAEAVQHLREAHVEVPGALASLTDRIAHAPRAAEAASDEDDEPFDNLPV
jgi:hypothetical protein